MKKWVLKAIVQKVISYLPFSRNINFFFQKHVTKGVHLSDEYFYDRLSHARSHLKAFNDHSGKSIPSSSLEIGTGWYPVVPIAFFLSGVNTIYSVDIELLTSKKRIQRTIQRILEAQKNGELSTYLNISPNRLETLSNIDGDFDNLSLDKIFEQVKLTYLIQDARKLELGDNSIDLVNSNNTFEHIYPELLKPILKEFKRIVNKDEGIMSHFIDMSDHFAHFDQSINIYNFLKFTEKQWARIDNSIQPQSRLRMDDYKKIYTDLKIPITEESFRPGNLKELESTKLSKPYSEKPMKINAISHCHFISRMNA